MSTLYVDNLEPNLGSQVEIPDLKPLAGSVVQTTTITSNSNYYWSSSGWVTVWQPSFTPKYSNSRLHFAVSINVLNESSNNTDLWLGWNNANGQYHYGFGKAGSLSGWNQNNNAVTYDAPAGSAAAQLLWIQLKGSGSETSYWNYNYGNGTARSTVTMWEIAQ